MKLACPILIWAFLLSLVEPARALNPERDIHQLAHRSWGEKEGYPGRAQALAQTTDGFLWIGSDIGLFRFDGVRFERYVPTSGDKLSGNTVLSLLALSDGSLWIAFDGNEICDSRNGNVKCYGKTDGVTSMPTAIVQDHEGTIWANTETGIIRFNGTRWEHIGKDWNFPENVPSLTSEALFVDHQGTLWAGVNQTVLYLKKGSKRFEPTGTFAGWSVSIAEAPDGTIWMADNSSYPRAISTLVSTKSAEIARCEVETPKGRPRKCPSESPPVVQISAPDQVFFDRNGSLWITSDTSGLVRVSHPEQLRDKVIPASSGALQRFNSKDGLSADNCDPVLEDREGNIWVATRDGLDQFRDTPLVPVPLPTSIVQIGMAPADGGDIWVAGSWNYVARTHGDARNVSLIPADVFKPYRDPAGATWLMGNSLGQWKDGQFRTVAPSPDGHFGNWGYWQIAGDRSGTLWAFSDGLGFFSLDHHRWRAWETPAKTANQHVANVFSDSTGLIWVSTYEGGLFTMDDGKILDYPISSGSPLRYVKAFAERAPRELWAGGDGGLVLIDRGRFRVIKPARDSFDVMGIIDTGVDGLWLSTADGVIHISGEETERALQDPSYRFQSERFDSADGLPGQTLQAYSHTNPYPTAIQGTDGRLWFTATRGVAWVDPTKIPRNAVPPPVSITSVSADGSRYRRLADLRFPAHTANVQIDYSALSLSVPERVRFRYKLDGIDHGWQDVGTRREAYYNNLGPGRYQFRVIASNNDGVWNEAGQTTEFSIAPAYYQTNWFRAMIVALVSVGAWGLYRLRLYQIAREFNVRLEERVSERTRLARDLHDTLLQSFHGLMLRFQAVSRLLPEGEGKAQLEKTLERADDAIAEGRNAVYDLRSSTKETNELFEALNAAGNELSQDRAAEFSLVVEGEPRDLQPIIRDELYRIAREALSNAFKHANARHIEAEIEYGERLFRLRIRDDGQGIPSEILQQGRAGHYGLAGMRERARQVGADLTIWSRAQSGTEIDLSLAGAIAYGRAPRQAGFGAFRKKV